MGEVMPMKPIGVLYATREGQTRRIAERVAQDLRARRFDVEFNNLRDEDDAIHPNDYSAVVLAASVHAGGYEREMVKFVNKHRAELEQLPTAFLSVTLSEAGAEMSGLRRNVPAARRMYGRSTISSLTRPGGARSGSSQWPALSGTRNTIHW